MDICLRALTACLLLLAIGASGGLVAAESAPDVESLKRGDVGMSQAVTDDQPLVETLRPHHDLAHLRGLSPLVGVVLLAIALIPLFVGWRLLRLSLALLVGCFCSVYVWQYGMPWLHHFWPTSTTTALVPALGFAAVAAFLLGMTLGWVLYRLQLALAGGLLGAMVLSLPGMYLDHPTLTGILALVGLVIGCIAGWMVAPYWAAVQTSILGAVLVVQGVAILTQQYVGADSLRLLAYGIGLAAGVLGCLVQVVWIIHHERSGSSLPDGGRPARV